MEIIDSRIADWKITLADTIADNASSGGLVLGVPVRWPASLDLSLTGCVFRRNGRIAGTGAGGGGARLALVNARCGWRTRSARAAPSWRPGTSS